jgi:hypothetical protein
MTRRSAIGLAATLACALVPASRLPAEEKAKEVWTDPGDPTLPPDFKIQGEYAGGSGAAKVGVQVIALGKGAFQAVVYPGGLPGDGWTGTGKSLMEGTLDGDKAVFKPAEGARKYLAGPPAEFSATRKFPPEGHQPFSATVAGGTMALTPAGGAAVALPSIVRKSPTLGAPPPAGAIVLFDGKGKTEWKGGRLDEAQGLLNTDGNDIFTQRKFSNYSMHVEFLLPYRPDARGQGRGNSGFYQVDHFEVQILDSFGLEGLNNECGGVYTKAAPKLNMCLPPLVWQTYDVDFTNAVAGADGKKTKNAVMTLRHNGVAIHEAREINGVTGGSRGEPEGTPGPIKLQGHGNPLQFRNIWIVEKP